LLLIKTQFDSARHTFDKVINIDAQSVPSAYNAQQPFMREKQYDSAKMYFNEAFHVYYGISRQTHNIIPVLILKQTMRSGAATNIITKTIAIDPKYTNAL